MKIAIVGTGVSGLTAAYHLQRQHELTLFEAADHIGGHVNTVDVEVDGGQFAIDTGFVVFNDRTYPHFTKLLEELNVERQPTTMGFSVRDQQSNLEYNGHSLNGLFAQRRNLLRPRFYRLLLDIARFNREATSLATNGSEDITVGEFLTRRRFSADLARWYLLPMGAAIWSCPAGAFADFPIRFIAEFYHHHGLLALTNRPQWYVVSGGARTYVDRLVQGFRDRIRLETPVARVSRYDDRVVIETNNAEAEIFDHVVFACHSDQALEILGSDATRTERELLSAFPYSRNVAVLHTDESLLPRSRRAWASWNYQTGPDDSAPPTVTYNMNILQGVKASKTICVTLNDQGQITTRCYGVLSIAIRSSRSVGQPRKRDTTNY